jgi:hypothetical protein
MIRLDRIKPWYTLEEAAARLTRNTGDTFTGSDVVQFVNERHLAVWMDARDRYAVQVAPACAYYSHPEDNPVLGLIGRTVEQVLASVPHGDEKARNSKLAELKRGAETLEVLWPSVDILAGIYELDVSEREDGVPMFNDDPRQAKIVFVNGTLLRDNDSVRSTVSDGLWAGSLLQLVRRRADCAATAFPTIEDFEPDDGMPARDQLLISNAEITRFERWYLASETDAPAAEEAEDGRLEDVLESDSDDWRSDPNDWRNKALAIANKIGEMKYARGEREITARSLGDAVATELEKDCSTYGTRGPRSAGSVRKYALAGWKFSPQSGANGANGAND